MDATTTEENDDKNKKKKDSTSTTKTTTTTTTKSEVEATGVGKKKRSSDQVFDVGGQGEGEGTTSKAKAAGGGFVGVAQRHTKKGGGSSRGVNGGGSKMSAVAAAPAAVGASASGIGDDQDQEGGKKKRGSDQVLQINSSNRRLNEDSSTSKRKKVPPKPTSSSSDADAAAVSVPVGRILEPIPASSTSPSKKKRAPKSSSPIRSLGSNVNQDDVDSSVQKTTTGLPIMTTTDSNHPSFATGNESTDTRPKKQSVDVSSSRTDFSTGDLLSSIPTGNFTSSRKSWTRRTKGPGVPSNRKVWDVESALMYLVSPPQPPSTSTSTPRQQGGNGENDNVESEREYLIKSSIDVVHNNLEKDGCVGTRSQSAQIEPSPWITFRIAHAGDASTLASWYQRQKRQDFRSRSNDSFDDNLQGEERGKGSSNNVNSKSTAAEEGLEDPDVTTREPHPPFDRRSSNGTNDDDDDDDNRNKNGGIHRSSSDLELGVNLNERLRCRSSSTASSAGDGSQKSPPNSTAFNVASDININCTSSGSSSSMLEHWIAEGLGDEDNCPSLYGLLAYVHRQQPPTGNTDSSSSSEEAVDHFSHSRSDNSDDDIQSPANSDENDEDPNCNVAAPYAVVRPTLSAAVLLTVTWQDGQRCLKIEWLAIGSGADGDDVNNTSVGDGDRPVPLQPLLALILQQKLWLRITALSLMIDCPLISMDEEVRSVMTNVAIEVDSQSSCQNDTAVSSRDTNATKDDEDDDDDDDGDDDDDDDENRSGINAVDRIDGENISDKRQEKMGDSEDFTKDNTIQKSSSI